MHTISSSRRGRLLTATSALAAAALAVSGILAAGSAASAATTRAATTSVDHTYLQDTLGVGQNTVIETVTYDRFQWLLQQPGQFAFLIGTSTDPAFAAQAQQVDAAARAAGAAKVYWFDPNLSGYSGAQNLDVRNPGNINLGTASQDAYAKIWTNLLGQYLGNGYKSVPAPNRTSVTVVRDDSVVNDAVSPAYDARTGQTSALGASDNALILYDKDHTSGADADKVVDWAKLGSASDQRLQEAFAAIGGGSAIDQLSQFAWWKDSANAKHALAYSDANRYGGDILDDADNAKGWRVQQITYPELIHLLKVNEANANFALLFGGTWCHNTRAVIKDVNAQAQQNGVATVYNFDLVLDGGTVNGSNGSSNPIHVRDNANNGSTFNYRPSFLYGDLVRTYLRNLITQYDPNTGNGVAYYPNGDTNAFPSVVRKLQVPFVLNYERGTGASPSSTSVKRQWIQQNFSDSTGLASFTEYMSEWWFTHPSKQLGLNFPIDNESVLDQGQLAQLQQARASAKFGAEAVERLAHFFGGLPGGVVSTQTVTAPAVKYGAQAKITVAVANAYGRIPTGNVTLKLNGTTRTAALAQNSATFTATGLVPGSYPYVVSYAGDDQVLGFEKTGTLIVKKATVSLKAVAKVKPTAVKPGSYTVTVSTPKGLSRATGKVTLTLSKGAKKQVVKASLKSGTAKVAVKALAAGKWKVSVAYAGDGKYASAKATAAALTVK